VGSSQTTGDAGTDAFLYSGGSMIDLGTLGGINSSSDAFGINADGQVVGVSWTVVDLSGGGISATGEAFLYSGGVMTDLGTLGAPGNGANGINDSGQVVGLSSTTGGGEDAFLYSGGTMIDLNSLLPAGSGWQLEDATGINDSGQIVGYGLFDYQPAAFLLDTSETQSPEPGSLNLLGAGLVALGLRRWLRPARKPRRAFGRGIIQI
jgi:probable HAF family extracellular repeat protein